MSLAQPAPAAIETDPTQLYATMKRAYDQGVTKGWPFSSELYYEATIFDAGRSYALFRPDDPNYSEVALLAVDIAAQLHYNPLVNNDASLWYVREAAAYALAHGDAAHQADATSLLHGFAATDADPAVLAQQAVAAAQANVQAFAHDPDALVAQLVADTRAYNLTHDISYRSDLLLKMADPAAPLVRVPDPEYGEMFSIAARALVETGFSDQDRVAARIVKFKRDHSPELRVIARVNSTPRELRLTRTAPADEYFGDLKFSPIGVRNQISRVEKYLDRGWGSRMEGDALQIKASIDDWQKQYPHDLTLPAALLNAYAMLERIDTQKTRDAALEIKSTLLVQYSGARQALELDPNA